MNDNNSIQKGFTLIEIMVTVAILGILTAIALPSYTESVKKGKRSDAKVELLRLAQMQESYFVQNLSYAKDLTQLGFAANTINSEEGLYTITMSGISPAGCNDPVNTLPACTEYHLTASRNMGAAQAGDTTCTDFRIDNVARKWAMGTTGSVSVATLPSAIAPITAPTANHITKSRNCW